MVRNEELLKRFEEEFAKKYKLSIEEKFKIYQWMFEEVKSLGRLPDVLYGIEDKIRLAGILNGIQRDN